MKKEKEVIIIKYLKSEVIPSFHSIGRLANVYLSNDRRYVDAYYFIEKPVK
jgi:hypothetical protein